MKQGTATSPFRQETAPQKTESAAEANNPTTNLGSVQHDRQSARPPQSLSSTSTVETPPFDLNRSFSERASFF